MKNFLWRACQKILPTQDNLCQRKITNDPRYSIYSQEAGTTSHILWSCSSAQDVWGASERIFEKSCKVEEDFCGLAEYFLQHGEEENFKLFALIARNIWLRRNEWVHEGWFTHPTEIVERASRQLQEFKNANMGGVANSRNPSDISQTWEKLQEGCFKVKYDAAVNWKKPKIGFGHHYSRSSGQC